jgi:hypothetical protein
MTKNVFNSCLLIGWLMIIGGLSLWSLATALVVGGVLLMGITLLLAFRAGVCTPKTNEETQEG